MKKILFFLFFIIFLFAALEFYSYMNTGIYSLLIPSDEAIINDESIILKTTTEDNQFSFVALQLWTDAPKDFLYNIRTSEQSMLGKQRGSYVHQLESGVYIVTLKANGNIRDEGVDLRVYLKKGKIYMYSFDVYSFNDKEVCFQEFSFGY